MSIKSYFKNGKKFYEVFVKAKDKDGKQIAKRKRGIKSERAAREVEFNIKQELTDQADGQQFWTWEKWHTECVQRMTFNRKKATVINYDGRLKKWIPKEWNEKTIGSVTQSDVYQLIFETIGSQTSSHSLKSILKMIRRIFQMAVDEGILVKNPTVGISVDAPRGEQKVLTAKEAEVFLKSAKEINHRFYPLWAFALLSGMRSGEMYALKWTDIDLDAGIISVTRQWTNKDGFGPTKTRENRVVPISPDLKQLILELKMERQAESEFLLPHLKEWTNGEQAQVTKDYCHGLGISEVKFHDLRATFITNLLAQGVPLVTVMAIVGHRKMSTTDVYLRLAGVSVKGATERLGYSLPQAQIAKVLQFGSQN